jgi:hypothetical protein
VYVEGGAVVRRRLQDGSEEWRHDFHVFRGILNLAVGLDRATVFAVYYTTDPNIRWTALDTTTGRERWTKVDRLLRTAGQGTAVFTDQGPSRALQGVDIRSGRTTWRSDVPARVAPPVFAASELQVNTASARITASATCTDG